MDINLGFDLKALSVFVLVAETGNMSHAAERLGTTQSSISQTLSSLEANLKTQLIDRSVRPLVITSAGRFFYDRASYLLKEAAQTSRDIKQENYEQLRQVNIAIVDSLVTAVGGPILEAVKHRTRDWSIKTGSSHMHAHGLLTHQLDIILSDDALEDHPDLCRFPILREPFIIALPNDYQVKQVDLASLCRDLDFVRYSEHSLIGQTIERYLRRTQLEPAMRLQLDNSYAIASMVSAGAGWTITTPLCLFQSGIKMHQVQCLPLPGESFERALTLVARNNELLDLPKTIAKDSRAILKDKFLQEVGAHLPWLEGQIVIQ